MRGSGGDPIKRGAISAIARLVKRSLKGHTSPTSLGLFRLSRARPAQSWRRPGKVGFLFRRQRDRRLLDPGESQQHARNLVLHLVGQGGASGDGLFEHAGHAAILAQFS